MIDLEIADTAFEKYARYGMSLLKDLTWYFQEAEPQARRKLLGSIFPAKLTFQDGNYRTSALNPALALILQKNKGLENEKAEDIAISENVSGDVGYVNIEPYLYVLDTYKKYDGEWIAHKAPPFVVTQPQLTLQIGLTPWMDFAINPTLSEQWHL